MYFCVNIVGTVFPLVPLCEIQGVFAGALDYLSWSYCRTRTSRLSMAHGMFSSAKLHSGERVRRVTSGMKLGVCIGRNCNRVCSILCRLLHANYSSSLYDSNVLQYRGVAFQSPPRDRDQSFFVCLVDIVATRRLFSTMNVPSGTYNRRVAKQNVAHIFARWYIGSSLCVCLLTTLFTVVWCSDNGFFLVGRARRVRFKNVGSSNDYRTL